jgi:hypothetical protein
MIDLQKVDVDRAGSGEPGIEAALEPALKYRSACEVIHG